jgi:hypothetical protein
VAVGQETAELAFVVLINPMGPYPMLPPLTVTVKVVVPEDNVIKAGEPGPVQLAVAGTLEPQAMLPPVTLTLAQDTQEGRG